MKKMFALILALAMVMTMGATVFAATVDSQTGNVVVDITNGNVSDETNIPVYHVVIAWGDLEFSYNFEGYTNLTKKWDPETHAYVIHGTQNGQEVVATGKWEGNTSNTVTVTNHSDDDVAVSAKFGDANSITNEGITATLSDNEFNLATAVGTLVANAPKDTFTVTVSGTPTTTDATDFGVGIITVTISAN